jgi:hypothetical protein
LRCKAKNKQNPRLDIAKGEEKYHSILFCGSVHSIDQKWIDIRFTKMFLNDYMCITKNQTIENQE